MAGFRQGPADTGFVEGKDVAIEYRWAEGNYERLPQMAALVVLADPFFSTASGPPHVIWEFQRCQWATLLLSRSQERD
jgi:hypothetical protein